ncbi:hypothetical protein Pmani_024156, partial [Petrolisthes manimaculis]
VSSKCVVESLVQQVSQLSDVEKFLLYLKLPVGRPPDTDPLKHAPPPRPLNPLGSRCEIQLTITWIRTHLEMNSEISLPKREVYDEYMHYCKLNNIKALSTADFGKVMKQVFPGVRPRRLGQRGASKYCYSGLRKKWALTPPDLPDLSQGMGGKSGTLDQGSSEGGGVEEEGEVEHAASSLVLEWAEKLCSVKFESVRDLALHLVHKNYVDNRSMAALTLLSLADHKQGVVVGGGVSGGGRHRETQLQLQRKLQEREHIREQKRKLQEQQPGVRCNERPKSRRRSGASRHPSGDATTTLTNGTPATPTKITPTTPTIAPIPTTNGVCDAGVGLGVGLEMTNGGNLTIKQEQTFDFLDSLTDEKLSLAKLTPDIPTVAPRRNCPTIGVGTESKKTPGNKVTKPSPSKKTLIFMPSAPSKTTSPKPRYKAIQPRTTESTPGIGTGTGTGIGGGGTQWADLLGGTLVAEDVNQPRQDTIQDVNNGGYIASGGNMVSGGSMIETQQQQQGCMLGPGGTIMGQGVGGCHSGQEPEDELFQYFDKKAEVEDAQVSNQLSELRKLLQRNLPAGPTQSGGGGGDVLEQDVPGVAGMRRRVSFQPTQDGIEGLNPLVGGQTVGSVPPSPNTRRAQFNFLPIPSVDQPQGVSQCSSANASPFMSPRNTPLPRSRHNSGQTSSTYVTPRSTPFTPDQPCQPPASESGTPFMSPITTPLYPRSRHNSSQNLRTPYTPTCRSRHSSGAPTFRHTPYPCEDGAGRRGGKFRSRHSSGSVPQSPSSAPLSPLVQDSTMLLHHDSSNLQLPSASMLHNMLKNKQQSGPGPGPGVGGGMSDLRRRHMSAGPTIHYQPQPPSFQPDPLAQEVSNVLTGNPPGPSGNRPQSVPLLQMLNASTCPEAYPKSQPNTPLTTGQQFNFSDYCGSQSASYAPTPVPSEYSDFPLDIDPQLDVGLPTDPSPGGLDPLDLLPQPSIQPADLSSLADPLNVPPNINPFSTSNDFREEIGSVVGEDRGCCMNRGGDGSTILRQEPLLGSTSMLTLNALNRHEFTLEENGNGGGLEEDFQPTLGDLGDQEVFNSLVLDVNKD